MALVPCRECGAQISTEAATCPRCGVSNPTSGALPRTSVSRGRTIVRWIFALWSLLWLFLLFKGCAAVGGDPNAAAHPTASGLGMIAAAFFIFAIWFCGALVLYLVRKFFVD